MYTPCKAISKIFNQCCTKFWGARSAESQKDFIHKQTIILKELRESQINLLILEDNNLSKDPSIINLALDESDQLIRIFAVSINKAKSKYQKHA